MSQDPNPIESPSSNPVKAFLDLLKSIFTKNKKDTPAK
jgi:hypothetical protein